MIIAASLAFLAMAQPPADAAAARVEMQNAETAYRRCMNAQGAGDNGATSDTRAGNMALSFCRPALETLLQAQIRSVELSDLPDRQKNQLRRRLRDSLRDLRDEALYPSRIPRNQPMDEGSLG